MEKLPTQRRASVHRASASVSASGARSVIQAPCWSITVQHKISDLGDIPLNVY
ncbi:hypothetical protein DEO72_LG2g3622 [Vigna unguiculata]|uniref:Uncharacterized protein n=1 Tax=Vigna unguiculata TaxID=3917 RepID=A0A4D6L478_VIGUN|nr:hypothetical protein DEO72_LG2g3622 [Vigna unguiculata]